MTSLTINLSDETAQALTAKARAQRLTVEEYARRLLELDLAPDWLQRASTRAKEAGVDPPSPDEIDEKIAAAREIAAARKARGESGHRRET